MIGLRDVGGLFGTTLYGNKVYSNTITNSTVTASNAEGSHADPWAGGIVGRLGGQFTTFRGNVNDNTTVTSYVAEHAGPIYGGPVANANDERVYNQTQQIWHPSISAAILAANDNDALLQAQAFILRTSSSIRKLLSTDPMLTALLEPHLPPYRERSQLTPAM